MSPQTAEFPSEIADQVEEVLEHVNAEHPDTVLLLARHVAGADGAAGASTASVATAAEMVAADPLGIDFALVVGEGRHPARLSLPAPVATGEELQAHVLGVLQEARAAVGDAVPLTSLERELAGGSTIPHHPARVVSTELVTPGLLEVRLGGLEGFAPLGPDTFVLAMVRTDGTPVDDGYQVSDYQAQGEDGPVRVAYYTVRHWDPAAAVLTLWVVLHHDTSGVAGWMEQAQPGDRLVLWGPRQAWDPPADTDSHLLVADETGLAAVAVILEQLPPGSRGVAVLEVGSELDVPPMPSHPAVEVRWIVRDGVEPGTDPRAVDAATLVRLDDGGRWAVFGAGESRQMTRLRRCVRREKGLAAAQVSVTGYWRRAVPPAG